MGPWIRHPQCSWRWFQDSNTVVWEKVTEDRWKQYIVESSSLRQTHHSLLHYKDSVFSSPLIQSQLYPATIEAASAGFFTVSVSGHHFIEPEQISPPDLWCHAVTPAALADTPPFFQHLISTPLTEQECEAIVGELQDKTLVTCSDGPLIPLRRLPPPIGLS